MGLTKGSNSKLKLIDLSDNTSVSDSGGTDTQALQPDEGHIYKIRAMKYQANSVGTSGTHRLDIILTDGTNEINIGYGASNFGANILISGSASEAMQIYADAAERPANPDAQLEWITKSLICSNSCYIDFKYTNNTNANQTANRVLFILVEEIPERT